MKTPYVDIHTHRRTGTGIELVSVMADLGALARQSDDAGDELQTAETAGADREMLLPAPPFSLGIHPWQLRDVEVNCTSEPDTFAAALNNIETSGASAIGEIGLDLLSGNPSLQEFVFVSQLRLAERLRKPVILHCVRTFEPVMKLLASFCLSAVLFHGFIGSAQQAAAALKKGYYLSFGQRSLESPKTVEALKRTPLTRLFLETDESSLPIAELYTQTAALLALPVSELMTQLYTNYQTVFEHDCTVA